MWGARGIRAWRNIQRSGRRGQKQDTGVSLGTHSIDACKGSNASSDLRSGSAQCLRENAGDAASTVSSKHGIMSATDGTSQTCFGDFPAIQRVAQLNAGDASYPGRRYGWQQIGREQDGAYQGLTIHTHQQGSIYMWPGTEMRDSHTVGRLAGFMKLSTKGISTRVQSYQPPSSDGVEQPVRSPLSQAPGPMDNVEGIPKAAVSRKESQAILNHDQADDALLQMAVSPKRAAKVVSKVVSSARANAVHNFGLNKDRLIVAEAFVGKDKYLHRLRMHGKGKAGKMVRPRCRLTVILKELSSEKEADLARLRVEKAHGRPPHSANAKLVPHRVLQTQWQWARKASKGRQPSVV